MNLSLKQFCDDIVTINIYEPEPVTILSRFCMTILQ